MSPLVIVAIAVVVFLVLAVALFKSMWRVAEPNEALVISGARSKTTTGIEGMGFRIITGHGTLVVPGVQVVRKLSLDLNETELQIECVTSQGIPVGVRGVVIFKVGDDPVSIANAARRFLDQQDKMTVRVHNVFAGHLRSIIGSLTVEEMIRDREKVTQQTRAASSSEMEKLGLIIDSLQIQEIVDPTGYISNLAKPYAVAVLRDARIAQAAADREATEREQEAEAFEVAALNASRIKQSQYQADAEQAASKAQQAGPLAAAQARQEVVVQETKVAELEAAKREQQLQVDVRKPADAEAYKARTLAQGDRDSRIAAAEAQAKETELRAVADARRTEVESEAKAKATLSVSTAEAHSVELRGKAEGTAIEARGNAEGAAVRAKGMAEADAIEARANALSKNQDAVIAQQLAENWPAVVASAAEAFKGIDQLTVLNGSQGIADSLTSIVSQGAAGFAVVRQLLSQSAEDGPAVAPAPPALPQARQDPEDPPLA